MPDDVHRRLKARAAIEGRSLSEWALAELTRSLERIATRAPVEPPVSAAEVIRELRGA